MARATRICKICGKEYEYCTTHNINNNFRWQDVACCPEHGAEYFRLIKESRAKARLIDIDEPKPSASETAPEETSSTLSYEEDATEKRSFFGSFINTDDEEDDIDEALDYDEDDEDEEDDAGAVG